MAFFRFHDGSIEKLTREMEEEKEKEMKAGK